MKTLDQRILDAKRELSNWRKEVDTLEQEKFEIEEKPRLNSMVGKCFKTTNNFSCPKEPEDYWFLYSMIVGVKGQHFCANKFQKDKNGRVEFWFDYYSYENLLGEEITKDEFKKEFDKVISYVKNLSEQEVSDIGSDE